MSLGLPYFVNTWTDIAVYNKRYKNIENRLHFGNLMNPIAFVLK